MINIKSKDDLVDCIGFRDKETNKLRITILIVHYGIINSSLSNLHV